MTLLAVGRADKAVPSSRDGLYETGPLGIVSKRPADFPYGGIDSVVGVYKDILAPQTFYDFLPGDDVALTLREENQQFHRDALQPDALDFPGRSLTAQFEIAAIELKLTEFVQRPRHGSYNRGKRL